LVSSYAAVVKFVHVDALVRIYMRVEVLDPVVLMNKDPVRPDIDGAALPIAANATKKLAVVPKIKRVVATEVDAATPFAKLAVPDMVVLANWAVPVNTGAAERTRLPVPVAVLDSVTPP